MSERELLRYFLGITDGDDVHALARKAVEARDSHYNHDKPNVSWWDRQARIREEVEPMLSSLVDLFVGESCSVD